MGIEGADFGRQISQCPEAYKVLKFVHRVADVSMPFFPRGNFNTARNSERKAGTSPAMLRIIVVCLVPWILMINICCIFDNAENIEYY